MTGFRFRFRLCSDDWDELGEFETIVPNWSRGDEALMTGDGRRFRIIGIVGVPDDVARASEQQWRLMEHPPSCAEPSIAAVHSNDNRRVRGIGQKCHDLPIVCSRQRPTFQRAHVPSHLDKK